MKICILNSFYDPDILGGAEISVKVLAEELNKRNIEVFIITTGKDDTVEYINGIKVYRVKCITPFNPKDYFTIDNRGRIKKIIYKILELNNPFNRKKLRMILKKEKPDTIHCNNIYGLSSSVWSIARSLNIKVVQTLRDYFIMCPKSTLICSDGEECKDSIKICKVYRALFKYMSRKVDYITTPSEYVLEKFCQQQYFDNILTKNVYNAIDIDLDKINKVYESKKNKKYHKLELIYLGSLTSHKGIEVLLRAFKSIENKDIKIHIAGKGPLESQIIKYCENDDRIKYHGFIKGKQLEDLLCKGDILIAPSIWNEPFGRIILDGYKFAMPVIVSNNGGLPEIVKHKKTGFILDEVSEDCIKDSILFFYNNKEIIKMMQENAMELLFKFSIEKQVDEFIKIYQGI